MNQDVLIAVLGGGNLIMFIKFLIERFDKKKEREEDKDLGLIKQELTKIKKDGIRSQLLLLILLRPEEQTEILTLGENYFKVLKGNWYMTSIFAKWLKDYNVGEPEWFKN